MAQTVKDVELRIGRTEKLLAGVLLVIVGWLGTGTVYLFNMYGDIRAIKQSATDHGTSIVGNIEQPANDEQLAANLALAAAQLQVARAEQRKADPQKMRRLSEAITQVTQSRPQILEAWQAAAQLVTYESKSSPSEPEQDCFAKAVPVVDLAPNPKSSAGYYMRYSNCTLILDFGDGFTKSAAGRDYLSFAAQRGWSAPSLDLLLDNVRIVYSGGAIIPFRTIFFNPNCTFDWKNPSRIPTKEGQALTAQLLTSDLSLKEFKYVPEA